MFSLFKTTRGMIVLIFLFCSLLVFLVWNQVIRQMDRERDDAISTAVQRNSNLAVSLEQYAIRTIRNADAVLQLVKMEYEKNGKEFDLHSLLNRGVIDVKYFHGVVIIDEKGQIQHTNLFLDSNSRNFSDREHYSFHKSRQKQLYISQPLLSRTINRDVIVFSRRIDKPDGSFGGTVAVQVIPSTFTQFYSSANLRPHDIISLISDEGITYARRTGNVESHGENIRKSPLFTHVAGQPVGNYHAKDAIRGIPTYFSYRKLDGYPVIATVGTSEADVLEPFYVRARKDYIFVSIITVALVLFSLLIANVMIQRKRITRKVRISEYRYRSIFESSQDAILVLTPGGHVEAMNKAACQLLRMSQNGYQQIFFKNLLKDSQPEIGLQSREWAQKGSKKEEVFFTRQDGSTFVGEVVRSVYQSFAGSNRFVLLIRDISFRKEMELRLLEEEKRYERQLTKQIILAQEREREAIGHEMHDNVNQILTTIKLYLEMAINNPSMRDDLLPKSIHHIMECIRDIRHLSRELSAPTLGTKSLVDSVKALADVVSSSSGLEICLNCDEYHTNLIKDQRLALYRILQEQLNNVVKHAAATRISIRLSQNGCTTQLLVSDNGKGFDVHANRNGIGLNNILSRAKVFGGEMFIDSSEGKGTTLKVVLPSMAATAEETCEKEELDLGIRMA